MKILVVLLSTIMILMPSKVNGAEKILLIPLDSRPFCTKTVADAARIASIDVVMPPSSMMDFFTVAGEVDRLRSWTLEHIGEVDAALLSIDQLTAGGLMASREKILSVAEIEGLIDFLIELRRRAPTKKIYAFSILPRHLPPAAIENYHQRRALMEYSRLMLRAERETEALLELERLILPANKRLYFDRFRRSEWLNKNLIGLTNVGVIDRLVIGCDDSEPHSFQNLLVRRLSKKIVGGDIFITHGADEIAAVLLAKHIVGARKLKIKVEYNERAAAYRVMPYMSVTVGAAVVEEIKLLGGEIVSAGEDFTLVVSVNRSDKKTRRARRALADEIGLKIARRERIALVDLSVHFDGDETLLPVMIERGVAINGLLAYSSFNTTGNAIGCALSEAAITMAVLERGEPTKVLGENINFLTGRVIEDQFYLKEAIDVVNGSLRKIDRDPAWLDVGLEFDTATFIMRAVMDEKVKRYGRSKSFLSPVEFETPKGLIKLRAERIEWWARYPWFRTFEIELNCAVGFMKATE